MPSATAPYDLIDLSVPLQHGAVSEPLKPKIRYIDHKKGAWQMRFLFGVKAKQLLRSRGLGWAMEKVSAITHTGTHVDAPYHYGPESEGRPARRIDEVPLEWCLAPGVRLDFRHLNDGDEITIEELQAALEKIDYRIQPGDIVLLQTGADARLASKDYFQQPGLGRDGTLWLVEQGVRVIGIDAYTIDRPFHSMKKDFRASGDAEVLWPAHFAGIEKEYCQIEKLAHLDRIPVDHGFLVSCLPVKIEGASAGWCRAIAMVPKGE
ncbi:MAG: cyclase family protein [Verrucomicrobiales bacterium]|nr:cyclase family protein [Verrucomicrobiales bacterium]